jgi:hypothetical protein
MNETVARIHQPVVVYGLLNKARYGNKLALGNRAQFIAAVAIVFTTAIITLACSNAGFGIFSAWTVIIPLVIFILRFDIGILCFVLSFGYQAPVLFDPRYGLSGTVRLDELIFGALFIAWLFQSKKGSFKDRPVPPLQNPLLFYTILAAISILPRLDAFNTTTFFVSAQGLKGFIPLVYKLAEVVFGYFIITHSKSNPALRSNILSSILTASMAVTILSFICSFGIIKQNLATTKYYDPNYYFTRFYLFGNTSSFGVIMVVHFLIMIYWFLATKSMWLRSVCIGGILSCCYVILITGTKTAYITITIALVFIVLNLRKRMSRLIIAFFALLILSYGLVYLVPHLASEQQQTEIQMQLNNAYIGLGLKGVEQAFDNTSLTGRKDAFSRFFKSIQEEPVLLIVGRGWHRRSMYKNGSSLHDDMLTAIHDLGLAGGIYVFWMYGAMFYGLNTIAKLKKKIDKTWKERDEILLACMNAMVIVLFISSFTTENLTLYAGIEIQLPLATMILGVAWTCLRPYQNRVITAK